MPLVLEVDILPDGFSIIRTSGEVITVSSADLTALQLVMSVPLVEPIINTLLALRLPADMFAAVHLTSVSPLLGQLLVSDVPITGSWW